MVEWFDDLAVGMRFKSQEKLVTREDIKRFASEFDPQPYHLDEAAAEGTPFKGLAASGWHTAAIAMRLAVEVRPFGPHPLLGLGVDELRWLAPVRPGDKLRLEGEVVELTPSKTRPQGIARIKWTAFNQHGDPVYTFTPIGIVPNLIAVLASILVFTVAASAALLLCLPRGIIRWLWFPLSGSGIRRTYFLGLIFPNQRVASLSHAGARRFIRRSSVKVGVAKGYIGLALLK